MPDPFKREESPQWLEVAVDWGIRAAASCTNGDLASRAIRTSLQTQRARLESILSDRGRQLRAVIRR